MGFIRQTWTLTKKNLLIVFWRAWFFTTIRAFLAPIIFMFFISYAKNFFVPPSEFGIGSPIPIRSLSNALDAAQGGRTTVALVNNGLTGGAIDSVIGNISATVRAAGKDVQVLSNEVDLLTTCANSLRGVSSCYAAASFHSSPTEGQGRIWNYTIRADGSFGTEIWVNRNDNDAEIYIIPFQHAIDAAIAAQTSGGTQLPVSIQEYPYTSESMQERNDNIRVLYMGTLINILALAFFIGMVGVTYHLTGHMAYERELGMSQLIEAMALNTRPWVTQAARLTANHLAFDIIYMPAWIIMGAIVQALVFPTSSMAIVLIYHLLNGFALSSFSILFAAFFKKAQLSGITVTIASIVLAIIAQVTHTKSSGAVAVLSLLFPPMNYTYFLIYLARWERLTLPANLAKGAPLPGTPSRAPWELPGIVFWVLLIIQIFLFPVLSGVVERVLYGTASSARRLKVDSADGSEAIRLTGFSKHYVPAWWYRVVAPRFGGKKKETVKAVNDLSVTALRGQIMVLLGANGSGKSTTLDSIAGLNRVTSGTIEVDGSGGLGLCPQKNVLWDDLTVFEHVKIFNALKTSGKKATKTETQQLVKACDLDIKLSAKAKTLSGGQKRKLQLAMMFTGGSRVCCVDEISSGLDPLSRRKIWDILLAERGTRTMMLTTHFLDEADVLSDQIVILSKGQLKAEGSAVELKHRLGGGYRIVLRRSSNYKAPEDFDHIPRKELYDETVYQCIDSAQASKLITKLEFEGIRDYQVNGPTVEDVFLKLAEELKHDLPDAKPTYLQGPRSKATGDELVSSDHESESKEDGSPQMTSGKMTGMFWQTWILFRKRLIILRRNYLPYCAAVIVPIVAGGLVMFFVQNQAAIGCSPGAAASSPSVQNLLWSFPFIQAPVGPSRRLTAQSVARITGLNTTSLHIVDTLAAFESYINDNYRTVTPGGFFLDPNSTPVFSYHGNWDVSYAVATQNMLNNFLTGIPISVYYSPFAVPFAPNTGDTLQLILYFGLAMSAYPGFFALYPTIERLRKVRALHYSNGIRAAPLWMAYLLFDFAFVLLISLIVTIIFVTSSSIWFYPGYLFVVFFLYGLTSILLSYVVSLFTTSQLAAFAFSAGMQCALFLLYFITYMCIITYVQPSYIDSAVTTAHFTFGLITPAGNLLRTLLLTLNEFSLLCRGPGQIASYPGAIKVYGGPILYLIIQAFVLFGVLVWYDSGYQPSFLARSQRHKPTDTEESELLDADVIEEAQRVEKCNDGLRVMHVNKTFKTNRAVQDISFGIPHGEVFALLGPNGAGKSTTISLIRGDIRPSVHEHQRGDVLIEDLSVLRHRASARTNLGVCPQFDAMDTMTVLEHLYFYARARGVSNAAQNVNAVITAVGLEAFKTRMAAKLSGGNKRKLSLAIALMGNPSVLLLDEPSSGMDAAAKRVMWRTLSSVSKNRALLITTHSMEEADALANRAGIMAGKMLALGTTRHLRERWGDAWYVHCVLTGAPRVEPERMEQARAWVEERIPGAVVEERMWHGQLRFRVPIHGSSNKEQVPSSPSSSHMNENGKAVAKVDVDDDDRGDAHDATGGTSIAALFQLLEDHKSELGLEYYSVSQTTLDQVFLSIVSKHNVQEEGHAKKEDKPKRGMGWLVQSCIS